MTTAIIALAIVAAVAYAVEHHHRRQVDAGSQVDARSHLAGGSPVDDADLSRVRTELAAIADHRPTPTTAHSRFAVAGRFHA